MIYKGGNVQNNKQQGFSHLIILIIIPLLGLVSFAGWYVWDKNHNSKKSSGSSERLAGTPTPTESPAPCPADYTEYRNATYAIKFCYPSAWGTVTAAPDWEQAQGHLDAGSGVALTFSDNNQVSANIRSKDWHHDPYYGHGGMDGSLSFSPIVADISDYSDGRLNHQTITATSTEYFVLTTFCQEGGCGGMGIILAKTVTGNSHTYGIAFRYDSGSTVELPFGATQADVDALDWSIISSATVDQFRVIGSTISNI